MSDEELAALENQLKNGSHWVDTVQNKDILAIVRELQDLRAYSKLCRDTVRNLAKILFIH